MFQINKTLIQRNFLNLFFRSTSTINQNDSLSNYLKMKIKMKGPITVAEYIKECLGNPKYVSLTLK